MPLTIARGRVLVAALALILALALPALGQRVPDASIDSMAALARGEWPAYAGTYDSARYSPLDQINAGNAGDLKIAWR